jgi:hypothetical protein
MSSIFPFRKAAVSQPTVEDFEALDLLDPVEYAAKERRLRWKIDLRLMPCLVLMIILKYVVISPE